MNGRFGVLRDSETQTVSASQAGPAAANKISAFSTRPIQQDVDEQVSQLVQRMFLSPNRGESPQLVMFSGVDRRAGCSWICARTAESLASQIHGRVCVVDGNLRSPSLHTYFRSALAPGFAEAMKQDEPIEQFLSPIDENHLWLMTSGVTGSVPNGALNPVRLRDRFAELRKQFDFLLVDAPAIACFNDALTIGRISDGVVLVIASNSTRREAARAAKQRFTDAKVPIIGAVLNKRTYPIPESLYRRL
jgi:succinoglycan biosynthesis transport protein ExoP